MTFIYSAIPANMKETLHEYLIACFHSIPSLTYYTPANHGQVFTGAYFFWYNQYALQVSFFQILGKYNYSIHDIG